MALGKPVPSCAGVFFSLATDDTMIFSKDGPGHTLAAARRLEDATARAKIAKHPDKDEDDRLNCTCIGVDLVQGR